MDKYIYNEKNGLWYEVQGNYYLPCLKLPEERTAYIGVWGQRHLRHLVSQGMLLHSADKRQAERLPCRPKRAGRGTVLSAGKTTCRKGRRNGSTQSGKPNAVGAENEQHPQRRYGGCFKRFDLRITSYRKGCCRRRRLFFFGKYSRSHKVPGVMEEGNTLRKKRVIF